MHSLETWTWKDKENLDKNKKPPVNWLVDADMLPSKIGRARIFTCDWPRDMYQPSDANPNERPVLFIASCLGGIILAKALVMAKDEQPRLIAAIGGVVFLATPFGGTSFKDVSAWVVPQRLTPRIENVGDTTFDLAEIVSNLTGLCKKLTFQISCSYELRDTDLAKKVTVLGYLLSS